MDQAASAVLTVARSVIEEMDLEVVLERVLDSARQLTGARYAAVGVLDESRTRLDRFSVLGIAPEARQAIGSLPTGRGVLGELIRHPCPLRLNDVGAHPDSFGFPPGHPPMRSFLGVPILVDGQPYGNLYLTEKADGSPFGGEDEQAAVLLAEFAGVAIDHARRFAGSERQRRELEMTVSALDATIQIARALGGETDLGAILALVAKRGRALVAARVLIIELLIGDELEMAAGAGELPPDLLGRRVDLAGTVAGEALRSRRTQRLSDEENRRRFERLGAGHLGLSVQDGLVVPLIFRDQPYGVLVVIDQLHQLSFGPEHAVLLEAFAASAATAVATARSVADERQRQRLTAAEAERARWARELHDETLQALGGLRLLLSAARRTGDAEQMDAVIGQALDQLELDTANLRALITELRPAALDQLGLAPALHALLDRARSTGLEIEAEVVLAYEESSAATRLVAELETAVYRIVQEALTNATKHGSASTAQVTVADDAEWVHVVVRDDGCGFDPAVRTRGLGLLGMRERAELLGGRLTVSSTPDGGTEVSAALPVSRRSPLDAAEASRSVVTADGHTARPG